MTPEITVIVCGTKCDHQWDGWYESEDGTLVSRVCSKCGRTAIDAAMEGK